MHSSELYNIAIGKRAIVLGDIECNVFEFSLSFDVVHKEPRHPAHRLTRRFAWQSTAWLLYSEN